MMDWIFTHALLPVLKVLYVPCDWLFGWTEHIPPIVSISIIGVISGVAVIVIQKFASDQKFLGRCKDDLAFQKKRMKEAKAADDKDALQRARSLSGKIGGKSFLATLKPSIWTVPLFLVIGLWTDSRLGYLPIHLGEEVTITAFFEDQAKGYAYVVPNDALKGSPLIAPIVNKDGTLQAEWKLQAGKEGENRISLRYAGQTHEVGLPIAKKGGRPPEHVTTFSEATPAQDHLLKIQITLADSIPSAWWNAIPAIWWTLELKWVAPYLIVTLGVWLLLRSLFKIH